MVNKKYTFEIVKNIFKEQKCELLEHDYKNTKQKLKYICNCGNESVITFESFKNGTRCKKCGYNKTSSTNRFSFENIKNFFKEQRCELLETEYTNCDTLMKYKCSCGNESHINFYNFKNGVRCKKCGIEKQKEARKLSYDDVYNYFKKYNCELLENKYVNAHIKMKYKCSCGNESEITFNSFQQGCRCNKCGTIKASDKLRLTYDFVRNSFQEQNCELLEIEYINTNTLMKYKCKCNNISKITFGSFQNGTRCKDCGEERSAKSSVLFKDYTLPSGNIIRIQGYEYIALDELVKIYKEDDILTNRRDMPEIKYILNGKEKRYYPDIWIKSKNIIIEVKSDYTYKKDLIKNIMKALATRKLSYNFEWWIYDNKMNKLIL